MVARRLIALLVVMLVLSTLAAALLPDPQGTAPPETSSTTTNRSPGSRSTGRLVRATLGAGERAHPRVVVSVGDQLVLRVRSRRPDQVEIRGFSLLADIDRFAPARFDLPAYQPGEYPVRLSDARRVIGTIVVRRQGESDERPGNAADGNG